jgi:hypothetical protein
MENVINTNIQLQIIYFFTINVENTNLKWTYIMCVIMRTMLITCMQ